MMGVTPKLRGLFYIKTELINHQPETKVLQSFETQDHRVTEIKIADCLLSQYLPLP